MLRPARLSALALALAACVPVKQADDADAGVAPRDMAPNRTLNDALVATDLEVGDASTDAVAGDAGTDGPLPDSDLTDEVCFQGGQERPCSMPRCAEGVEVCVEGVWSRCRYPEERCDGADNDCDGEIDEGLGIGDACTLGQGECAAEGVTGCGPDGEIACQATPGRPSPERCDGLDNDCDGSADEGIGLAEACSVGEGACTREGLGVCDDEGGVRCDATPGEPVDEGCDGVDNDCDGEVDEGLGLGERCEVGEGQCRRVGVAVCGDGGAVTCNAEPGAPEPETCDGTDEDCDGSVDEDFDVGQVCERGNGDCVAEGVVVCIDAQTSECNAMPGAPEVCDGLDNDCDGAADEGFDVGAACVVGGGICRADGEVVCADDGTATCDAVVPFEIDLGDGHDGALMVDGEVVLEAGRRYEFTAVTVLAGGTLTVEPWDGEVGGVADVVVSGRFVVERGGVVDVSGRGYRGGAANPKQVLGYENQWTNDGGTTGYHGEGPGGGGGGWAAPQQTVGAGGGGGHGAAGAAGVPCGQDDRGNYSVWDVNDEVARPIPNQLPRFSSGGEAYADAEVAELLPGSGGGSGGNNYDGGANGVGGAGGHGGGAIRVAAQEIRIEGTLLADGTNAEPGVGGNYVGGGGGGSGGAIHLVGLLVVNDGEVRAAGGAGADGTNGSNGGAGAVGRIRVDAGEEQGEGVYAPEPGLRGELACALE